MRVGDYEVYDVSALIGESLVTYPGDPRPVLKFVKRLAEGGSSNLSELCLGSHTGTHVDAPLHFKDGAPSVDKISLDVLVGPARVVDMTGLEAITLADLDAADLGGVERVLFKTDNSKLWSDPAFHEKFTYLEEDAAVYLVETGVRLVGVDYLSVEKPRTKTHPTHRALLGAHVVVIEGLNLSEVPPGDYELFCLPLRVEGAEAAPARVILRRPA